MRWPGSWVSISYCVEQTASVSFYTPLTTAIFDRGNNFTMIIAGRQREICHRLKIRMRQRWLGRLRMSFPLAHHLPNTTTPTTTTTIIVIMTDPTPTPIIITTPAVVEEEEEEDRSVMWRWKLSVRQTHTVTKYG